MNPTGLTFALFLPVVLVLYWLVPRRAGAQNAVLLAASYVFYLSWSPEWLPLLLLATAIDWLAGRLLDDGRLGQRQRSAVLLVSLISNIGALAWFKYRGFFAASFVALLESAGVSVSLPVISVVLPIGLSYYTLIKIGYVVDVYFGRVPACRSPLTFATFVAFFPQLLAGPITRAGQMLPQLAAPRAPTTAMCSRAASALLLGWFMKGYVADWIAPAVVDPVFATAGVAGAFSHWLALLGYAVQVFCDFAGYSLLAIGIGRLFGVELPPNFDRPFLSRSMPELWRRWHISLNTWLFDYLYGPMVTARGVLHGRIATNLVLVFALSGLWHGAQWTFVLWGVLHGLALAAHHWWDVWYRGKCRGDRRWVTARRSLPYGLAAWGLAQAWFLASLILFRAPDLGTARDFATGLLGAGSGPGLAFDEIMTLNLIVAFGFVIWHHAEGWAPGARLRARFDDLPAPVRGFTFGLVIVWLLVFAPLARGTFIYAQF